MSVKITSLELENVKRVRAVTMTPDQDGLTVIGGDNCQGKTSILDAICYALGGERKRPTNLQRDDSAADARILLTLSNGLTVERKGKNATLYVTDPTGQKAGQKLLDAFVEELALDLPKFLAMTGREKGRVLLRILGIEDQLAKLETEEKAAYDQRTVQGRVTESKTHHAAEMPEYHDVPETPLSAGELVAQSQAIMARNAERANARSHVERMALVLGTANAKEERLQIRLTEIQAELEAATAERNSAHMAWLDAKDAPITEDESTEEVRQNIDQMELVNAKVRANLDKRKAQEDAERAAEEYGRLGTIVDEVRARRMALLDGASMPLPGLSVTDGELTYSGKAWDCMSSAEQIRAGVAIVRALRPECGFVLLDGLERMDTTQQDELDGWLIDEGLQAIATRVSKGAECTIIIEDGMVAGAEEPAAVAEKTAELDW